jgi:choline dehydrogenase-like flavoprotein
VGQERFDFDAIVVGSGITGGWAAKELCEKGLKTVLLERGRNLEHVSGYHSAALPPWEFPHRSSLTPEEKEKHKIQNRHFSIKEENKHLYVNDLKTRITKLNDTTGSEQMYSVVDPCYGGE